MKTRIRHLLSLGALLVALAAVVVLLTSQAEAAHAYVSPAAPAKEIAAAPPLALQAGITASNIPASTCTLSGTVRTCHLWAMTGTMTMPTGASVPIWGFADNAAGPAQVPGPTLVGNINETLELVLHNQLLSETVSLAFPGQPGYVNDLVGIPAGATSAITYTLPLTPGTFLYEAGMTPNGVLQVAMGMYGPLIVRPVTQTQAYQDPSTTFQDEALLVLGEIDPVFHSDPFAFEISEYRPTYWHINGKAYPETDRIPTAAGNTVLLRYLNGGLKSHWMAPGGLLVRTIASDGHIRFPTHLSLVEHVSAGMTLDVLTTVPMSATTGMLYPLYDANLLLHNANQRLVGGELAYGGMMTFLEVHTGTTPLPAGPLTSNVLVGPNPTTGAAGVTLTATIGATATQAEFFTNTLGITGTAMTVNGSQATFYIDAATLATWPSGFIVFYVHSSADGTLWGPPGSVILNLDKTGPRTIGMTLAPEPSNGSSPVSLRATGDDHSTGRSNVVSATYTIDGLNPAPMLLDRTDSPITAMSTTLTITTLGNLGEGLHPVAIISEDSLGNVGAPGIVTLTLDLTGPTTPTVILTPNLLDLSTAPAVTAVRLDATLSDALSAGVQSPLANAEAFINAIGPDGTGFNIFPSDGLFDEITEDAYFEIPIANFLYLAQGDHTIYVHGKDAAGNWGTFGSATLTIDRGVTDMEGPVITGLSVAPNPTDGTLIVEVAAAAADPGWLSNVAGAEWFVGADPGPGGGTPLQAVDGAFDSPEESVAGFINVSGWQNRNYDLSVRAVDSLGNWGATVSVRLQVSNNAAAVILLDGFETGTFDAWTAVVGAVSITADAAMPPAARSSLLGMEADATGGTPAYVGHAMLSGETTYQARFWYDPNSTDMGPGEHDIFVGLDAGTPIFGIQYEGTAALGYEIRAWVLAAGAPAYTQWYDIDDAPHQLAIGWASDPAASFYLKVDGAVLEELAGLDTAAYIVDEVRLGPSAGLDPAQAGIEYFDEFEAVRQVSIRLFLPIISRSQ